MVHFARPSHTARTLVLSTAATLVAGFGLLVASPTAGAQEKVPPVQDEIRPTDDIQYSGKPLVDPEVQVKPFNECYVKNEDGSVVSYFGYELASKVDAKLPAGTGYNFVTGAPANSGQPSVYSAGPHHFVFSVTWNSNEEAPSWTLNGNSVGATDSGTVCKEVPAVPEFPFAAAGPVIAVGAFGAWFVSRRRRVTSMA